MRINARLEDSYEEKFLKIQQLENKSRTEILKEALDRYFADELKQLEQQAWEDNQKILAMIGGITSGSEDGSVQYKKEIKEYLDGKYADC